MVLNKTPKDLKVGDRVTTEFNGSRGATTVYTVTAIFNEEHFQDELAVTLERDICPHCNQPIGRAAPTKLAAAWAVPIGSI